MRIKEPLLCCFLKVMFSSLQVFQQLEATKKVYVLTALTMSAEGANNLNLPHNRKIYSLNPASRELSLLGERNFFSLSTFAAQATSSLESLL